MWWAWHIMLCYNFGIRYLKKWQHCTSNYACSTSSGTEEQNVKVTSKELISVCGINSVYADGILHGNS